LNVFERCRCLRFNELDEVVVRRVLEGMIGSLYTHPEDVKELAVAAMLYMMDSTVVRRRLLSLAGWEKPLVLELLELARLEHTRRYGMALLVTFLGYDDLRHLVVRAAMKILRIVILGFGTARQKMVPE
jgi:hypothetical protein